MEISEELKKILLKAARKSIEMEFRDIDLPEPEYEKYPLLLQLHGAFVTLTIDKELRGCIGYIVAQQPLFDTVVNAAKNAAFNDPRFSQLKEDELDKIDIEISVLSEFKPISSYDEIEIGKHGLLLDEGGRGVLLPQVPVEHNMDREQFLTAICHKSGLYGNYWKERMLNLKVFTAEVFSEEGD